ncbi:MAG: DUF2064 domain-containing protein [Thermoanaerobaculia bacterium]|nr:DUF2064 domain-containing protein [Thermoanaerobaculia bacterium]
MNSSDHRSSTALPPALVVFTLGAAVEARRRALLPPHARTHEYAFYQATLERTLRAGRHAGLAVAVASPSAVTIAAGVEKIRQPSGSFGERLIGSITLARGASNRGWIAVGTDCPDLEAATFRRVAEGLATHPHRVILGPAEDGGVYLIAANGCPQTLLSNVSWGHRRTRESLRQSLEGLGLEVEELPTLADIDDRGALRRWLASPVAHSPLWADIAGVLREAIQRAPSSLQRPQGRVRCPVNPPWAGRAPPL